MYEKRSCITEEGKCKMKVLAIVFNVSIRLCLEARWSESSSLTGVSQQLTKPSTNNKNNFKVQIFKNKYCSRHN